MINVRNIFGIVFIILVSIYMLFGDPDSFNWGSYYFCVWNLIIIWISSMAIKIYRDKLHGIIVKIIMGISLSKFFLNAYSFFDINIFNKINRSYEIGAVMVGCIIIFLIYKKYGLVKR
jgi:hypothetical protein